MKFLKWIPLLLICLLCVSCGRRSDKLKFGIVRPSIDHLPYSFALHSGDLDLNQLETVEFATGWELGEALAAGKVDAGIIPFSFVWNAVSRGFPVKTVSFLERETDAVIAEPGTTNLSMLDGKKIGLLRASSVDLLWRDLARSRNLSYTPVFFRAPNEIIAALRKGEISAATLYVPLINKLDSEFNVLHWFGDEHPGHPCCDLAVNTNKIYGAKLIILKQLLAQLDRTSALLNSENHELIKFMAEEYELNPSQSEAALQRSVFSTGLDIRGKEFEIGMMQFARQQGYIHTVPPALDVYWELEKP